DFVLEPDTTRFPRINVHYPTKEENKLDGWAWKVTVKNLNDEAKNGPLYGKTVCLKDNVCLADVPCLNGTDVFSNWVPKTDATVVTRILEAGGIITGKAMCENLFAFAVSNTAAQGPIGNPYDPTRSAGGSSSGTGVLVATGQADMGIGGDQGGSKCVPAAHVGIVGLKPTYGLGPYTGIVPSEFSVDQTDISNVFSKDVLSNALLLQVIAGIDGIDDRQGPGTPLPSEVPKYHSLLLAAR
ncbi:amidase signature domain-containing protein, partial [Hysterangium stoloniferum]